jgi:type IV pilus assembly protein PilE
MNIRDLNTQSSKLSLAKYKVPAVNSLGFSLIELMIVVAIVGVLAAIALPAYQNSVLAGGRAEAQSLLLEVAANQERFYSDNNSYSTNANPLVAPALAKVTSEGGIYEVAVAACAGGAITNCFVATATPQGNQTADSCTTLTISNTGLKGSTGDTLDTCWR